MNRRTVIAVLLAIAAPIASAQMKDHPGLSANVAAQVARVRAANSDSARRNIYQPTWSSLAQYRTSGWFRDAKFGIFIHWGVYSVPAFGNEWYSRNMYVPGSPAFEHHVATYGPQTKFGYKDFIPMFRAQHFDPNAWLDLFARAGAKYIVPVAEHCDGFLMYDAAMTTWDAAKMGLHRDIVGELEEATRAHGLHFGVSSHRAEHWWWYGAGRTFPSDVQDPGNAGLYGPAEPMSLPSPDGTTGAKEPDPSHLERWLPPNQAFLDDWLARSTELVDKYHLDVVPGFSAVAPVLASDPTGALTGQHYPKSLMRPDRHGLGPRIGVSWRPIPGSSMVVRAGYGITYDTSVYQGIAIRMAQQAPLAKSLTVENSRACPLTLANGFNVCAGSTPQTFGVDPNFRVGYAQSWDLKVQRDLPWSLQMVATYLGIKGTRGVQEFLPNTNPAGAVNPCPSCPAGFVYLTSNGNSTREAGQIQLRRRLHSGFTASVLYTFSKSIDDDSSLGGKGAATLGSATIAQDWRDLRGERGLSTFDQRHLATVLVQYTTGMGMGGGTLLSGWRGRLYKEWTLQTQINIGSGLPQTPIDSSVVVSGYSAFVRPNVTGAPLYAAPPGLFLNPAAYAAPLAGQWGNARRNAIIGPAEFSLNAAMVRTFRLDAKVNLDLQVAAANALNHVVYSGWITNINSTQFGLPASANAMRSFETSLRLRF